MLSAKRKFVPDKAPVINLAVDILLSVLTGSVMVFLASFFWGGPAVWVDFLFFLPDGRESPLGFMVLIPIITPVISILITRSLIEEVASSKGWLRAAFVVAITSTITVFALRVLIDIKDEDAISLAKVDLVAILPFVVFFIFFGFLMGLLPGVIFAPKRRALKILVAAFASAMVGGVYALISIYAVSTS